ncbi:MAG: hypothetical protein WB593_12980, partial [Candidatus Sulfotelmatobacter sp.]
GGGCAHVGVDARARVHGELGGEGANTAARTNDQHGLAGQRLDALHMDAVVGMALYSGKISP